MNKEKEILLLRMQSQLGDITLKITELDQIQRSENGKFKAVISYVTKDK